MAWLEATVASAREHRSVVESQKATEMSNLTATFRWIIEEGDLALGMRWFEAGLVFGSIITLGHARQGWRRWRQAFMHSRETVPIQAQVKAINYIGLFAWYDRDFAQAAALLEEGLALARTLDDPDTLIDALERRSSIVGWVVA